MKILIIGNIYTLLIACLVYKDIKKSFYIVASRSLEKVKLNIKIDFQVKNYKKLKYLLLLINLRLKFLLLNKISLVVGNGHLIFSGSIIRKRKFILLEDGTRNYEQIRNQNIRDLVLSFLGKLSMKKEIKRAEKIYLTGIAPIPKEIAHKVEIINLKELWNKKTLEEQNEILDIFSFDLNIKNKIKGRDIILFTQPLSEDAVITEKEKIEIYSKIIKKYPKDKLIIKTHPREKTNYKEIFKEYLILDNPFPFEILNLLDVKFNKAITLFSTAALGLGEKVEVDFYGTEVHPKILERFGSCNNIMERNCFLREE